MFVKCLKLMNFRNYNQLSLTFSDQYNVLYGENAQGKTNILEAVFLCATGRSHRTSKDTEMIQFSAEKASVELVLFKPDFGEIKIEIELGASGRKKVKLNEVQLKRMGDIMGHLNCVIFSPEDLNIIKDEPQQRRRFLDMFISQIRPAYFFDLQQYIGTMRHRNVLLKQIREERNRGTYQSPNLSTLDVWDEQLSLLGARIMETRKNYINKLAYYTEKNHCEITASKEVSIAKYLPSVKITEEEFTGGRQIIQDCFLRGLKGGREADISRTSTSVGSHRDDLCFFIDGKNVKLYGSQGQQRTTALALKMAQVDVMKEETGDMPVLLLDDVMSELDRERQDNLILNMKKTQTILTGTEQFLAEGRGEKEYDKAAHKFYRITRGTAE